MKKTITFSMKLISFITFPAMIGLMILNRPIIQVLFERGLFNIESTIMTSSCLFFFAMGLPFISYVKILAPAFYSLKDTRTPVIVAFVVMVGYISLSFLLMRTMRVSGIALALSVSSVLNFLLLFLLLEKKIGRVKIKGILFSMLKSALSAVLMGGAILIFLNKFSFDDLTPLSRLGTLGAAILAGIAAYALSSLIFNRRDLKNVMSLFSKKKIAKE